MGLAERRKIKTFCDGLEEAQNDLNTYLGFELPVTLDIESFPEDPAVVAGYECYKQYGFPQAIAVLKEVGQDDMGKEALKEQISAVIIQNTSSSGDDGGERSVSLQDKTLTIKVGFYGYSDKLWDQAALRTQVEAML